DQRPPLTR
ncbi:membrane protein, partial [Streptomyces sp. TUS-ST3]